MGRLYFTIVLLKTHFNTFHNQKRQSIYGVNLETSLSDSCDGVAMGT